LKSRNEYMRKYRKTHKENLQVLRRRYSRLYHDKRNKIFELLGNKCIRCGFTDKRALQIDHKNGHGYEEKREFGSGRKYLQHVLKSILNGEDKYQLLCANCNWIKRYERKEHS